MQLDSLAPETPARAPPLSALTSERVRVMMLERLQVNNLVAQPSLTMLERVLVFTSTQTGMDKIFKVRSPMLHAHRRRRLTRRPMSPLLPVCARLSKIWHLWRPPPRRPDRKRTRAPSVCAP